MISQRDKKKAQGGLSTHDGERNPIYPALGGWPRAIYIAPDALRQASMDAEPVVRKTCRPTMSTRKITPEPNDRPGYSDRSERAPWALVTGAGPLNSESYHHSKRDTPRRHGVDVQVEQDRLSLAFSRKISTKKPP